MKHSNALNTKSELAKSLDLGPYIDMQRARRIWTANKAICQYIAASPEPCDIATDNFMVHLVQINDAVCTALVKCCTHQNNESSAINHVGPRRTLT